MTDFMYISLCLILLAFGAVCMISDAVQRSAELEYKLRLKEEAFRACEKQKQDWDKCFKSVFSDFIEG
jgi:hypothetical protein